MVEIVNQEITRKDVQNLLLIGKLHFNTYDLREISFKIKNTKLIDKRYITRDS